MRQVLLPTDGSDNAHHAMRYAVSIYGTNAKYRIVNSWMMPHAGASMLVSLDAELSKDSAELLGREVAWFKGEFTSVGDVETVSEKGDLVQVLNILVDDPVNQLVAMGTKGASGIEEMIIGSNTAAVIGKVDCPVLAVPADAKTQHPKSIVLASDYREINDELALQPLVELVTAKNSQLSILHVNDNGEEVEAEKYAESLKLRDYFKDIEPRFDGPSNQDVTEGINEYSERIEADMVVVLARNEGFFHRIFNRSESKKLAMHTRLPLLVLHDK